jgi:hypothetical protein
MHLHPWHRGKIIDSSGCQIVFNLISEHPSLVAHELCQHCGVVSGSRSYVNNRFTFSWFERGEAEGV